MRGGRGRGGLLNLKSHVDELKGYTEDNLNRLLVVKPGAMWAISKASSDYKMKCSVPTNLYGYQVNWEAKCRSVRILNHLWCHRGGREQLVTAQEHPVCSGFLPKNILWGEEGNDSPCLRETAGPPQLSNWGTSGVKTLTIRTCDVKELKGFFFKKNIKVENAISRLNEPTSCWSGIAKDSHSWTLPGTVSEFP